MPSPASIFNVMPKGENQFWLQILRQLHLCCILSMYCEIFFPVMHAYIFEEGESVLSLKSFVFSLLAKHHLSFDASRRKLRNKNRKKKKINAKAAFYPSLTTTVWSFNCSVL